MNDKLKQILAETSKVFILTDENVAPFWLSELEHWLNCEKAVEIVVKAGEQHKNLQTVQRIWKTLMRHQADRNALLINLGGGVITDLGGFAASTYKRGIPFINIPTTLLGMVDAAIGGKTAIDLGGAKNVVGTFAEAEDVIINQVFLQTLPQRQVLSGIAEMLKYSFIDDSKLREIDLGNYRDYIYRAGEIKCGIVACDFKEKGLRKILNFGHTLGHAIESYGLTTSNLLLHGEAVALGMCAALWLSFKMFGLNEELLEGYLEKLPMLLSEANLHLTQSDVVPILAYLVHDKKNEHGQPRFVLMKSEGKAVWGIEVDMDMVRQSLCYTINKVRHL